MNRTKGFTDPKICPVSLDISKDWYVWFRFFDGATWKQLRYKRDLNCFKTLRERLPQANALKQLLKEELESGWNPIIKASEQPIRIYSIQEAITHIMNIKTATLSKKSKEAYTYITKLLLAWLDSQTKLNLHVKRFSSAMAQEYMDQLLLKKKYSGRTFNDHLIILRTFFNCFIEREWIERNPFRSVKKKTQTIGRNLAYTDSEKELLEKTLIEKNIRLYCLTQFMYHCFIRRTEMTFLKVKHIDKINHTIIIPGENAKNRHQESVVIPMGLEPVIAAMELEKYSSEDYLFGRGLKTCSRPIKNPNWLSTWHNDIVKSLGIDPQKGLYSWKHSGVCRYYTRTKDIYSIMRQLRHRDMKTTEIYLKSLGLIMNDTFRNAMVA